MSGQGLVFVFCFCLKEDFFPSFKELMDKIYIWKQKTHTCKHTTELPLWNVFHVAVYIL